MSKETSEIAFTPPNESETCSSERRASPAAIAWRSFMRRALRVGRRMDRHVDDLGRADELALAAVLVGDLGRDRGLGGAVVEALDQRRVALGDEAAAHLLRARQLAVVGVELLGQDEKALDLRARHHRFVRPAPD